jgi:hypothetical protein
MPMKPEIDKRKTKQRLDARDIRVNGAYVNPIPHKSHTNIGSCGCRRGLKKWCWHCVSSHNGGRLFFEVNVCRQLNTFTG